MLESGTFGSVRGVLGNEHPYRDPLGLVTSKSFKAIAGHHA